MTIDAVTSISESSSYSKAASRPSEQTRVSICSRSFSQKFTNTTVFDFHVFDISFFCFFIFPTLGTLVVFFECPKTTPMNLRFFFTDLFTYSQCLCLRISFIKLLFSTSGSVTSYFPVIHVQAILLISVTKKFVST
jgi:hypothetical protein